MGWLWIGFLVLIGTLAIGLELFIPGGILGLIGLVLMVSAVFTAYGLYGLEGAGYVLLGEVGLVGIGFYLWAKHFPKTRLGKSFALSDDPDDRPTLHGQDALRGKRGKIVTPCHPSGTVEIDGRRHDVISEGGLIPVGTEVTVIEVEGPRVVVREA